MEASIPNDTETPRTPRSAVDLSRSRSPRRLYGARSPGFRTYWLVQTSTGRPVNYSAFNKALITACASAEVPRVSSHSLRHTYVSWMIDEGHSADKVAFWIGDTPETVRSVYAHMLEESSAPAAASIDIALSGIS
jgi:integrase